jgi:DNA repair exonuclease SbcCD ATPase subunit
VVNEDRRNNISGLQHKVRWLQQELALARTLAARCSTPAGSSSNRSSLDEAAMQQQQQLAPVAPAAVAAHKQLQEQQQHLRQLLQLMSELGDRNSQLEEALEFCQSERTELERSCLESRQELAAMQVSLQQVRELPSLLPWCGRGWRTAAPGAERVCAQRMQAVKENKSWRHRWFKPDKGSKGQPAASLALSLPQEDSLAAAAALAAQDSSSNTAGAQDTPPQQQQQQQQQSPATHSGWRGMLKGVKRNTASGSAAAAPAPSTAAGAADTAQQEQQRQEQLQQEQEQLAQREAALARVLHVVASHVAALAPADSAADGAAEDAGGVTAQQVTQDLQDLHCMPEVRVSGCWCD